MGISCLPTKIGRQQVPSTRLLNFMIGYPGRINSRFDTTGEAKSFQKSQTHIEADCQTMLRLYSHMRTSIQARSWFRNIRNHLGFTQLLTGSSQDGIRTTGGFCKAVYTAEVHGEWMNVYISMFLKEPSCVDTWDDYARSFGY